MVTGLLRNPPKSLPLASSSETSPPTLASGSDWRAWSTAARAGPWRHPHLQQPPVLLLDPLEFPTLLRSQQPGDLVLSIARDGNKTRLRFVSQFSQLFLGIHENPVHLASLHR